ncbi:hypothetical protein NBRC10513v2_003836 [Rhodotorula toruloides]
MVGHDHYRRPSVVVVEPTWTTTTKPSRSRPSEQSRRDTLSRAPVGFVRLGDSGQDDCYRNGYGVYAVTKKLLSSARLPSDEVVLTGRAGLSALLRAFSQHIDSPLYCVAQTGFSIVLDELIPKATVHDILNSKHAVCVLHGLYADEQPEYRSTEAWYAEDHANEIMSGCLNIALGSASRGIAMSVAGQIFLGETFSPEAMLFDHPRDCKALSDRYCRISVPWYGCDARIPPNIKTRTPPIFLLMYLSTFSTSKPLLSSSPLKHLSPSDLDTSFATGAVDFLYFWPLVPLFYLRMKLGDTRQFDVLSEARLDHTSFAEVGKMVSPRVIAELLSFTRVLVDLDKQDIVANAAARWAEETFRLTVSQSERWKVFVRYTISWAEHMLEPAPAPSDPRHSRPRQSSHPDDSHPSRSRSTRSAHPTSRHAPPPPVDGPYYSEPSSDEDSRVGSSTDEDVYDLPPLRPKTRSRRTKEDPQISRRFSGIPAPQPYALSGEDGYEASRTTRKKKTDKSSSKTPATFFGVPVVRDRYKAKDRESRRR